MPEEQRRKCPLEEGKECPALKANPGAECPFLNRILNLEVDLAKVKVNIKWLITLMIPMFVAIMSLFFKTVIEVWFGG